MTTGSLAILHVFAATLRKCSAEAHSSVSASFPDFLPMKMDHPLPLQFAAVPYRRDPEGLKILLVTSRETQRWVLPKGWPIKDLQPHQSAAREALEEAGVKGTVKKKAVGEYSYFKRMPQHFVLCSVRLYPLEVAEQLETWKEKGQRRLAWFAPEEAALRVDEPELATILRDFPARIDRAA
jgi:8-oxo-dGTP pyrophosphatase MutT (NUDIX family)